jgi:hypothetical protein
MKCKQIIVMLGYTALPTYQVCMYISEEPISAGYICIYVLNRYLQKDDEMKHWNEASPKFTKMAAFFVDEKIHF